MESPAVCGSAAHGKFTRSAQPGTKADWPKTAQFNVQFTGGLPHSFTWVFKMTLKQFAMIIKGPGYEPAVHRAHLNSSEFSTTVVCVSSFDEAVSVAVELHEQGIQLIELCGGFTPDQASAIHGAMAMRIPVGVVRYDPKEQQQLAQLFAP